MTAAFYLPHKLDPNQSSAQIAYQYALETSMRKKLHVLGLGLLVLLGCFIFSKAINYSIEQVKLAKQVKLMISVINVDTDMMHVWNSPATFKLSGLGRPALNYGVLELMLSDSPGTRAKAEEILRNITRHDFGLPDNQSDANAKNYLLWKQLWKDNGDFDALSDDENKMKDSYLKWRAWLEKRNSTGENLFRELLR